MEPGSVMAQNTLKKSAVNVSSWTTALVSESHPTFTVISVAVVLTLPNSTTWRLSTQIKKYRKGGKMKLLSPISTVPLSTVTAEDSTDQTTPESDYVEEDKWSQYESGQ